MTEMSYRAGTNGIVNDSSAQDMDLLAEVERVSPFIELGATGLKRAAGIVDEEFLPQLRGRKAVQVYKEMSENDPLVGSLLFAVDRLLRNVEWTVEPAGKGKDEAEAAKLVETCMDDMSHPWSDFISEVLSCLVFGWSWHEIVYKRRQGPWARDVKGRSKYTDDYIGWRKLPIRAQETLVRWVFDDTGDVQAMLQMAPPHYGTTMLPIERSLLFRYRHAKGNPEGISMLRNAYRPWYMKKRLEEFEAVGVERDLAGLPIVKVPAEFLRAKPGSEQAKIVDAFKKMVKSVRRDEQEGIVFPVSYDQDTKQPLYSFELLTSGGSRSFNTDQIIRRYEERILMTVLADFILVGHQGTGSYSMHLDKTGIFRTALNSVAEMIADTLNRFAIPRLFMVNGWKPAELPRIVPSDVDAPDLNQLATFMSAMSNTGITWFPDGDLENFVRDVARLPKLDDDEVELRRQMQLRDEAARFAEANATYVQAVQMEAAARSGQLPLPGMENQQPGGGQGQAAKPGQSNGGGKPADKARSKPKPADKPKPKGGA